MRTSTVAVAVDVDSRRLAIPERYWTWMLRAGVMMVPATLCVLHGAALQTFAATLWRLAN